MKFILYYRYRYYIYILEKTCINFIVFSMFSSTEQITVCGTTGAVLSGGACSSQGGTVSAVTSLPSSRESSCASCPGITPPYRVVMLGSSGVGKSSIVSQFMTSEYLQASGISIGKY